jgi:hypothetical protein
MPTTYAVPDGRTAMAATLWTGNQAARTIDNSANGVFFQPDFVWTKSRSAVESHRLSDSVRGGNGTVLYELNSNETAAEGTDTDVSGFATNGFTIQAGSNSPNVTGRTYVGWQWKANGTAVTNTAGSVTSTVSANTTTGFSVVTASLSGTSPVTIGHGLGVAPKFIIGKVRNNSTNWYVYSSNFSASDYLIFNNSDAKATSSNIWDVAPTSTVFTVGNPQNGWNGGTSGSYNYIFYCWSQIAGYSKFGSYTGNGSSNGPFVYLGFRPRWIMIKRSDTSGNGWIIVDSTRNPANTSANGGMQNVLSAQSSGAEDTGADVCDGLSNGFKFYQSSSGFNANGGTYIYAAFAENPFAYANAR